MNDNPYASPNAAAKPNVPSTRKKGIVVSTLICTLPLLSFMYTVAFWISSSVALGAPIQPGRDDPKSFLFGIPHAISILMMLLTFAICPIVVAVGHRKRRLLLHVSVYASSLALSLLLYRLDIFQITSWIAD